MTLDDFDRVPLLFGPSPIHPLPRLSAALGGGVEVWAKREDCNSGIAFGGNKVRKLEYLVADALAQGCDTLVSIGGVQSNHTRAVTGVACHLGLAAVTVQEHWVDWTRRALRPRRQHPADAHHGRRRPPRRGRVRHRRAGQLAGGPSTPCSAAGGKPYPIPAGASDHPLGGLGFANWAREVAAQEAELDVFFDHVIVCTVTGSTHAGMIAGFALEGRDGRRVIGIDASKTLEQTVDQVTRIANDTAERIGLGRALRPEEICDRRRLRRTGLRHPGRRHDRGHPPRRPHRGHAHRPGLRGQVDGRADRHGQVRRDPRRLEGAVRPPRRAACAVRLRRDARPRVKDAST